MCDPGQTGLPFPERFPSWKIPRREFQGGRQKSAVSVWKAAGIMELPGRPWQESAGSLSIFRVHPFLSADNKLGSSARDCHDQYSSCSYDNRYWEEHWHETVPYSHKACRCRNKHRRYNFNQEIRGTFDLFKFYNSCTQGKHH